MVTRSPPAKKVPVKASHKKKVHIPRPKPTPLASVRTQARSKADALRILGGGEIKGRWGEEACPDLPKSATPLDVMIEAMRRAYRLGGPIAAFPFAEKAAPYLHAKISSIELKTPTPGSAEGHGTRFLVEFVDPPVPAALPPPADD